MRKLGLVGGLGPGATLHYYRELSRLDAGEFLIIQADMQHGLSHIKRGDREGLARYFAGLIDRMARGGAEVATISAVTPHFCIRELIPISPLPLINLVEEIAAAIRASGYGKVALFGTRYTVESSGLTVATQPDTMKPRPKSYDRIARGSGAISLAAAFLKTR